MVCEAHKLPKIFEVAITHRSTLALIFALPFVTLVTGVDAWEMDDIPPKAPDPCPANGKLHDEVIPNVGIFAVATIESTLWVPPGLIELVGKEPPPNYVFHCAAGAAKDALISVDVLHG